LDLSYPTVRSRLEEVIGAMGYAVGEPAAEGGERRQEILQRLARQEITSEEALHLLEE
jgi:hypothetical protein